MKTSSLLAGAALAGLLTGSLAQATTPSGNSSRENISAGVLADAPDKDKEKHDCKGKNSCKGKGGCRSSDNGCKGKNSCKGKGGCASSMK